MHTTYIAIMHLIERNRGSKEGVQDVWVTVDLLVDHEAKDTHHGSTAVVELNSLLVDNGLLVPLGLCKVDLLDLVLATRVSHLKETDEEDDLHKTAKRDSLEASKTSFHRREWNAVCDLTRESISLGGDDVAEDGQHGNTAVLGLDITVELECLSIGILQQTKRIEETLKGK